MSHWLLCEVVAEQLFGPQATHRERAVAGRESVLPRWRVRARRERTRRRPKPSSKAGWHFLTTWTSSQCFLKHPNGGSCPAASCAPTGGGVGSAAVSRITRRTRLRLTGTPSLRRFACRLTCRTRVTVAAARVRDLVLAARRRARGRRCQCRAVLFPWVALGEACCVASAAAAAQTSEAKALERVLSASLPGCV
jgi:hypothetical protein